MQEIHDFMDQLLIDKGVTGIDNEIKERVIEDMTQMLMKQIDQATIDALTDEQADELANKLNSGELKDEDVPQYLTDAGLDLQQITLVTMMQFRELYLGNVDASQDYAEVEKKNTEEQTEVANAQ